MDQQTICLLNDSFPPIIDGVANAVLNYAENLKHFGARPIVVTPSHPQADDSGYPYPVIRYPSINFHKMDGYVAGFPFSPETARKLSDEKVSLIHSHCPIVSTFMARELRQITDAPIVLTYHTKFDVDIENVIKSQRVQDACKKALVTNISACDEVWVVSKGAGENLRSLGYEGEYIVMPNGVDLPHGRVSNDRILQTIRDYDLPEDVPVYLFVGRMMWYKGIRLILDALAQLKRQDKDFRMVFIGEGTDRSEIVSYAVCTGLMENCIFTGAVRDRETLRAWYGRADLFLFPSTFDTNGLVVREAAANDLPSVLITDSCAAENIADGRNGFLVEEDSESLYRCLLSLHYDQDKLRSVGQMAGKELYVSWEDSVKLAMERYECVIDRHKNGVISHTRKPLDGVMKANGELMQALGKLHQHRIQLKEL